jgi:cell wall-associated NlpC family hydrolase
MNADLNRDMNRKLDKINIATFDMVNPEGTNDPELFYSILANNEYSKAQLALINYSRQFLGTTYIFGATDPNQGFDCSGFTQFAYKNALGKNLPRTALQMSQVGFSVDDTNQLKAGDLVFFNTRGFDYSHVGIYIGEGKFFHASTKLNAVVLGDINNDYFSKRYNGARRVMGESNFVQYNGLNTSG